MDKRGLNVQQWILDYLFGLMIGENLEAVVKFIIDKVKEIIDDIRDERVKAAINADLMILGQRNDLQRDLGLTEQWVVQVIKQILNNVLTQVDFNVVYDWLLDFVEDYAASLEDGTLKSVLELAAKNIREVFDIPDLPDTEA